MWQFRVPENLQGNTYPSNPCHRNELISGPNSLIKINSFELLGNCFWREGFEAAFGPDRMGEKGGYQKNLAS
jgi:hypothetical protein